MSPLMPSYFLVICRPVAMETLLSHYWLLLHRLSYKFLTECVVVKYVNCKHTKIKLAQRLPMLSYMFCVIQRESSSTYRVGQKSKPWQIWKKIIVTFSGTFEVKQSINIPPHLKCIATLPTEIAY